MTMCTLSSPLCRNGGDGVSHKGVAGRGVHNVRDALLPTKTRACTPSRPPGRAPAWRPGRRWQGCRRRRDAWLAESDSRREDFPEAFARVADHTVGPSQRPPAVPDTPLSPTPRFCVPWRRFPERSWSVSSSSRVRGSKRRRSGVRTRGTRRYGAQSRLRCGWTEKPAVCIATPAVSVERGVALP